MSQGESRIVASGQPAHVWEQLITSLWRIFGDANNDAEVSESRNEGKLEIANVADIIGARHAHRVVAVAGHVSADDAGAGG